MACFQFHINLQLSISSSEILIINRGGNILLMGLAFANGMPELFMFVVINAISILLALSFGIL